MIKKANPPQNGDLSDIYVNKKEAKAIVHAHRLALLQFQLIKKRSSFSHMVAVAGGEDINSKYATFEQKIFQEI